MNAPHNTHISEAAIMAAFSDAIRAATLLKRACAAKAEGWAKVGDAKLGESPSLEPKLAIGKKGRGAKLEEANPKDPMEAIELWFGVNDARMGFIADLSPACARELAAALYAHADAAETMPKGGAA